MAAVAVTPFHQALATRRDRYNAQFRQARRGNRQLDPQAVLGHLGEFAGPAVDAAARAGGDPVAVTDALVELTFELAARGQLGVAGRPPDPAVALAFGQVLPALGGFVAGQPRRVATAVLNALHHLCASPTGRPRDWGRVLLELAGRAPDPDALLAAGVVAAWRCGLARLRGTALTIASTVDTELLGVALVAGAPVDAAALARLAADPWLDPGAAVRAPAGTRLLVVRRVGAFRGFGGVFGSPPTVSHVDGQWFAQDGTGSWLVHADRFGAELTRATDPGPGGFGDTLALSGGRVSDPAGALDVPELTEPTSWAAAGATLAATTRFTHSVLFVARTAG